MATTHEYILKTITPSNGQAILKVESGQSIVIVGANGAGKTRLGAHIESTISPGPSHRIAAHKSLALNDAISLISLDRAISTLHHGFPELQHANRAGHRWQGKPATQLLNDFDALLQSLFAEHAAVATKHLGDRAKNLNAPLPVTKLQTLKKLWHELLPHRVLDTDNMSVRVKTSEDSSEFYPGSEMSDGERVMFYFIGQSLMAPSEGVIIVDEPESHIHKAIVVPLWEAIARARPDCSFVYITHDLDFAVAQVGSEKYFVRSHNPKDLQWNIEEIPKDTGLPDSLVAHIVGSRKPILFVEGEQSSLDLMIYRSHYAAFTVIPLGSSEHVVTATASYKATAVINWVVARGLVDRDHRSDEEIQYLGDRDVYVLPVSEVENVLLMAAVFRELAAKLTDDPDNKLEELIDVVCTETTRHLDAVCCRHVSRRLDKQLKKIEVTTRNLNALKASYDSAITLIDPVSTHALFKASLEERITRRDLDGILELYDNKGLLAAASKLFGFTEQALKMQFKRLLADATLGRGLRDAIASALPAIPVPPTSGIATSTSRNNTVAAAQL